MLDWFGSHNVLTQVLGSKTKSDEAHYKGEST